MTIQFRQTILLPQLYRIRYSVPKLCHRGKRPKCCRQMRKRLQIDFCWILHQQLQVFSEALHIQAPNCDAKGFARDHLGET